MATFTKKAIRDSFVKLLSENPLSQITVKNIVDDCGVNRNTFYYYYHDIPELLESIVDDEIEKIISEYPTIDTIEDCLTVAMKFALENRKAALHMFRSVSRDVYERYQWHVCRHLVTAYIDSLLTGHTVSPEDRQIIIDYTVCLCFGFVVGWLEKGMPDDILAKVHRLCELKQGEVERMIERCETSE